MAFRLSRLVQLAAQRHLALPQHLSSSPLVAAPLTLRYTSSSSNNASQFQSMPSPPRLPADQQAEFERLQRTANTQEGFNPTSTPDFSPNTVAATTPVVEDEFSSIPLRKGAPPEFEGDVNPKTGEVGGPKNEPLRWGPAGDYSFNGRVTDF
ncbi:DUF1674-domain-containing protein [Hypoxylon sp. NC1633]|nr:DUF1674-domain-containing protein [Hypoxylon sp. NC1633]